MGDKILQQQVELLRRELAVLFPPHRILGAAVDHDKLVFWAAAGVDASVGAERAAGGDLGFIAGKGKFVESGLREIPMNGLQALKTEFIGAIGAVSHTRFLHETPPQTLPPEDQAS